MNKRSFDTFNKSQYLLKEKGNGCDITIDITNYLHKYEHLNTIIIPNLSKCLNYDKKVYKSLYYKCMRNINIILDNDNLEFINIEKYIFPILENCDNFIKNENLDRKKIKETIFERIFQTNLLETTILQELIEIINKEKYAKNTMDYILVKIHKCYNYMYCIFNKKEKDISFNCKKLILIVKLINGIQYIKYILNYKIKEENKIKNFQDNTINKNTQIEKKKFEIMYKKIKLSSIEKSEDSTNRNLTIVDKKNITNNSIKQLKSEKILTPFDDDVEDQLIDEYKMNSKNIDIFDIDLNEIYESD